MKYKYYYMFEDFMWHYDFLIIVSIILLFALIGVGTLIHVWIYWTFAEIIEDTHKEANNGTS